MTSTSISHSTKKYLKLAEREAAFHTIPHILCQVLKLELSYFDSKNLILRWSQKKS